MNVSVLFVLNRKGLPEVFKKSLVERTTSWWSGPKAWLSLDTKSLLVTLHGLITFANLEEDRGNVVPEDSNVSMVCAKNLASNTKTLMKHCFTTSNCSYLKRTYPMEFKEATSA